LVCAKYLKSNSWLDPSIIWKSLSTSLVPAGYAIVTINSPSGKLFKKYWQLMVPQAWPEGKILAERATTGVDVGGIFERNTVFPKEVIQNVIPVIDGLERGGKIKRC
jgi:hypothetical protein